MVEETDATTAVVYVIVVVVAVLIGTVLAPVVWNAAQGSGGDGDPTVSVVTLRAGTDPVNVNRITEDLRAARTNKSVDAVVLRIDSQGGAVTSSEEFYLAVNRTAQELPVVAYVEGVAASGGYYGILPADQIVVKPSSTVGSVGIIVQAPLSEVERRGRTTRTLLRSGPEKATLSKDSIRNQMETLQNAFLNTVLFHRGENISLNRTEIARGDAYLGPTAVQNGFADRVGDLNTAIEEAARRAGLGENYDVVYREPVTPPRSGTTLVEGDVSKVDGDVIYVDASDEDVEFRQPVKYYAVWGVPVADDSHGGSNPTGSAGGNATATGSSAGATADDLGGASPAANDVEVRTHASG